MRGRFIVFEGLDGSGKSTHVRRLHRRLCDSGVDAVAHREPTDGDIGKLIRSALTGRVELNADTLALLFAADRREHIAQVEDELAAGRTVLCDRYLYSSLAYQSLELPFERIYEYNRVNYEALAPDVLIYIDLPPDVCYNRILSRCGRTELFEKPERLLTIYTNFKRAFEYIDERTRLITIDGDRDIDAVAQDVWSAVCE